MKKKFDFADLANNLATRFLFKYFPAQGEEHTYNPVLAVCLENFGTCIPYQEGTMRERRDEHPQTASPLCRGRTADAKWATNPSGDVWADGWWGENPGPGQPGKNWAQCLADDHRVFRATEGCTESVPLVFGVETVLWPTAAKKGGKWYRGVVEAAECFMTVLYRNGAESSCLRHAREDAKRDDQGKKGVEGQPY